MTQHKHSHLDAFLSLAWYDTFLRFITNFVAKTSELLLATGLVVSSANFLTDGAILGTITPASQAWAWAQALAIDSSLAISFYHILFCIKQRDWIKCILYSLLTSLLALVAGTITNIDILSHAMHVPITHAMILMGINVELLSSVRSIAVIGFILMSRLSDVSMKELTTPEADTSLAPTEPQQLNPQDQKGSPPEPVPSTGAPHFTIEDITLLLQVLAHANGTTVTPIMMEPDPAQTHQHHSDHLDPAQTSDEATMGADVDPTRSQEQAPDPSHADQIHEPAMQPHPIQGIQRHATPAPDPDPQKEFQAAPATQPHGAAPDLHVTDQQIPQRSREERLTLAYQELVAEGQKISGRTLATRAHMHRSLCTEWLRIHQSRPSPHDMNMPPQQEPKGDQAAQSP